MIIMTPEYQTYLTIGRKFSDSVESQLFGKPCFKINGKAFICFFENEMVFKLSGNFHSEALQLKGSHLFDPSGKKRPMKEWVQVTSMYIDQWSSLARYSFQFLTENNSNNKK